MVNQITKMRLPDGSEVAFVDWQDQPIYSTVWALTGFSDEELFLFTYAPGDPISKSDNINTGYTSTLLDTNTSTAGSLNETEEMLVYSIRPEYSVFDVADAQTPSLVDLVIDGAASMGLPNISITQLKLLQDSLLLQLKVSMKTMHQERLGYYNTGFGPTGQGMIYPTATTTQRSFGAAGLPSQDAVRSLAMPIYIGGGEKFRVLLVNPSTDGGSTNSTGAVDFGYSEASTPVLSTTRVAKIVVHLDGLHKRPVS